MAIRSATRARPGGVPSTFGSLVAEIPLGNGTESTFPTEVAVTPDNTRAYVTLTGTGQVAVVDTMTLQEVDVHATNPAVSTLSTGPIAAPDGVALDPALRVAELDGPTAIRGTVDVPDLDHWTLELAMWEVAYVPILTITSGTSEVNSATLATFDPAALNVPNGFYRLRLTAYDTNGNATIDEVYIGVDANPRSKEIDLPAGAEPDGIAIDPSGDYAYVSDARSYALGGEDSNGTTVAAAPLVSQVYVIDINPASPTYNQLVETIQLDTSAPVDGSEPQVANLDGLIAPDGLAEIAVTPDGMQLDVAAPNGNPDTSDDGYKPDPQAGQFADQPGNLVQINLKPQKNFQPPSVTSIVAIPANSGTFGVAIEPQAVAAQAAKQSGQPIQYAVAFTNSTQDVAGVEVLNPALGGKIAISMDLDPFDLDPSNPLFQYAENTADDSLFTTQWLQVHNAGGIVFTPDGQYAFVAAQANEVTTVTGGGYDGDADDLIASAISGYLDQESNPLYEDGNVAIIKNPLGNPNDPNPANRPMVVGATRPIPDGFPIDLGLSPPDANGQQFLYVSYSGLPTATLNSNPSNPDIGDGAVFIFNATAMIQEVSSLSQTPDGSLILDEFPVDDLVGTEPTVSNEPNTDIDVRADYRSNYLPTDPKDTTDPSAIVFGVFDSATFAPIGLGGFTGGLAIESGPAPELTVLQPEPVDLVANNTFVITTTVDAINGTVSTTGGDFSFTLNTPATVKLVIQDDENGDITSENIPDPRDNTQSLSLEDFNEDGIALSPGTYSTSLAILGSQETPGDYTFTLSATTAAGETTSTDGTITLEEQRTEGLPAGHTIIDGVDIWDGHLTVTSEDVDIQGRGLDLDFTRTYSSAGNSSAGPLGAGWTDSYNVQLVQNTNGTFTVVGGDGSGNTFGAAGTQNSVEAQEYGLPASALFYNPQVGYHSVLVRPTASPNEFYSYTTDHTLYDFQLQPGIAPYGQVYTLRYIQDSNGNRVSLYYNQDPTGTLPTDPNLQADLSGPALALGVVEDSSGRALLFQYQYIFNANRIVKITGYNNTGTGVGNLLGLEIDYSYDKWGNLINVTRIDSGTGVVLREEAYTYSPGSGATAHNLLSYTDPNGFDAQGNPVGNVADFTTTYAYYGLDPAGNPIAGDEFDSNGNYIGSYALPVSGFNPAFGVPLYEMVQSVTQPGGATGSGEPFSTINFTYNISTSLNTPNTRVVSNANPAIPPTTYTLDSYGATTEVNAPNGQGQLGSNITYMTWSDPSSPDPAAFSAVDGALTPDEVMGIDVEMTSETDPLGQKTSYVYDVNGNVVQQTISFAGMSSAYLPVTQADGTTPVADDEVITSYTFDPVFNVMTSETDADGHTTFDIYDSLYESMNPLTNLPKLAGGASVPAFTGQNTGNLLATIDAMGDTTTYQYATVGAYNGAYGPGDLMSVTDPRGNKTQYLQYDAYGDAMVIEDAAGNYTTQTFDVRSRMISQTVYGGQSSAHSTTVYVYDGLDRVIRETEFDDLDPSDNQFSLSHDAGLPQVTMTAGQVAQATSSTLPQPYTGEEWAEETINQYLPDGELAQTVNGLGMVTSFQYDNAGRRILETETNFGVAPNSPVAVATQYVTLFAYDANNNVVRETDPRGITTVYKYDDLYNLIETDVEPLPSVDLPVGNNQLEVTKATFDLLGNMLSQTDIHGDTTTYQYDGLYRLVLTTLPVPGESGEPAETRSAYDPVGNAVLQTDANGNATLYSYDKANRLLVETDPMGNEIEYAYDPDGNTILETDLSPVNETPNGAAAGSADQVTYIIGYSYDALNRPTGMVQYVVLGDPTVLGAPVAQSQLPTQTVTGPNQAIYVTTYSYNDELDTVLTTDPRGNDPQDDVKGETLDQMDGLDRLASETVDYGGLDLTTTYTYDADGNQASMTDATGSKITYIHDGLDRLIETVFPQLSGGVQYTESFYYDGDNNQIANIDQRGIIYSTNYDNLNRIVAQNLKETISNQGQWLTLEGYAFDDPANTVTMTDADGNQTVTKYDALGRPLVVTDAYGNTIVSTYDGMNLISQVDQNKNITVDKYDLDNRLVETDEYDSSEVLQATTTYVYDDAQNQTIVEGPREVDGSPIEIITQNDSLGRLISESVSNPTLSGEYDASVVTLEQKQYDGDGNLVMSTDADGNVTKYVYDGANRQVEMIQAFGSPVQATTTYTYDKVGDLVSVKDARRTAPRRSRSRRTRTPRLRPRLIRTTRTMHCTE